MNNKLQPKLILFDFDGTLADTFELTVKVIESFSKNLKLDLTHREIIDLIHNKPIKEIVKEIKVNKIKLFYYLILGKYKMRKIISRADLFDNVEETLSELKKRNYKLGIITSNSEKNVNLFLKKYDLKNYFDFVQSKFSLFGKDKIFSNIIHKNNFNLDDLIYVGDEIRDLNSARKIGIDCIILNYGFNSKKLIDTKKPKFEIGKFEDILKIVK